MAAELFRTKSKILVSIVETNTPPQDALFLDDFHPSGDIDPYTNGALALVYAMTGEVDKSIKLLQSCEKFMNYDGAFFNTEGTIELAPTGLIAATYGILADSDRSNKLIEKMEAHFITELNRYISELEVKGSEVKIGWGPTDAASASVALAYASLGDTVKAREIVSLFDGKMIGDEGCPVTSDVALVALSNIVVDCNVDTLLEIIDRAKDERKILFYNLPTMTEECYRLSEKNSKYGRWGERDNIASTRANALVACVYTAIGGKN